MQNLKLNDRKIDSFVSIGIFFVSTLLVYIFFNLWNYDFSVPLYYADEDLLFSSRIIKNIGEHGQCLINPLMGAPFEATQYDFPLYGDTLNLIVLWIIYQFSHDFGITINVFFLLLFPITAIISYQVMRVLKINRLFAVLCSLSFAFLPFRFIHNQSHLFLSNYAVIPLATLLLIWFQTDEQFFRINKCFFQYRRNITALIILITTALSGIYYAFFTCFFLLVVLVLSIGSHPIRSWYKDLSRNIAAVGVVVLAIMLAAIPTFGLLNQSGQTSQTLYRSPEQSEIFALKIMQFFYPYQSHGIGPLQDLINEYAKAPLPNEGSEYLGFLGIIGFLFLLFLLFWRFRGKSGYTEHFSLLSKLNISGLLLATIGGLGSAFAYFVSEQIRAYNRISVFIAFFSVLALAMGLTEIYNRIERSIWKIIFVAVLIQMSLLGLFEQVIIEKDHTTQNASFYSDRNFVAEVENDAGDQGMIFQLPYYKFPESAPVNKMRDYALTRGYLHSDTLRWSYGDFRGRQSDMWNESVSQLPFPDMIKTISLVGFDGIYIDTWAYTKTQLNDLQKKIENELNNDPIISDDNRLMYYSMKEYNAEMMKEYSKEELDKMAMDALYDPQV